MKFMQTASTSFTVRRPSLQDGRRVWRLVRESSPLELNAPYLYVLLCYHFIDTCVVAEEDGEIVGFTAAYLPPVRSNSVFIGQIAVHPNCREQGVAGQMITDLLRRDVCADVCYLEATASPTNEASRALFESLARRLDSVCDRCSSFPSSLFGGESHEEEQLLRIGPFTALASIGAANQAASRGGGDRT